MATEIELKLEVEPGDLPLVHQSPLLARAESRTDHQVTVYYDTPETILKNHGWTLRVRSVAGRFIQTVKSGTDSVGLVAREEIENPVGSARPDLTLLAGHPICTLLAGEDAGSLAPVVRSDVDRTSWTIESHGGQLRVDLDQGIISARGRSAKFAEIEFELVDGTPAGLIAAARRLSDHVPVRLGVLTKAERGYLLANNKLHRVTKAAHVHVGRGMTIAGAFETIVHACLKHYRLNEPLVIHRSKTEALHQARVAMRRLRSAFTLFRPAINDVEFQHLRDELRWFTSQLGAARNLDVYLERDLEEEERSRLDHERDQAYAQAIEAMNSHRFRQLLIDLVGWTAIGAWKSSKIAERPIDGFAGKRLDQLWESIMSRGRNLAAMDAASRHALRIQAKKLRYATEFLCDLYPAARPREKEFARAIARLQELLGKLNDLATATGFAAPARCEAWLIGSVHESRLLAASETVLEELRRVGPFWRDEQFG